MKRIISMAAASAVLLAAGCSGGGNADADGDGKVSIGEAAKEGRAQGISPEPGQYKAVITMTGMEIPGMPPEMAGHGSGMTTTAEYCLTQQDVEKGFEEMMKRGQNGDCRYERFALDGGTMDAVMICTTQEGEARMTMNGTVSPTSSEFTAAMAMPIPDVGEGKMTFTAKHERVGDCPAS